MAPAANLIYNPMPQLNLITSFFFSHVFTQGKLHIIKVYQHEFGEAKYLQRYSHSGSAHPNSKYVIK